MNHPFVSLLSVILLPVATMACGDDESCGPGTEATPTVQASQGDQTLAFGNLSAGANNDCPPEEGGPTSISIQGQQTDDGATGFLTLCLPRPAELGTSPVTMSDERLVQIVDFRGQDTDGCTLSVIRTGDLSGAQVAFSGVCDNGTHPDGFAMTLSGTLPFTRSCSTDGGPGDTEVTVTLSGTATVVAE